MDTWDDYKHHSTWKGLTHSIRSFIYPFIIHSLTHSFISLGCRGSLVHSPT